MNKSTSLYLYATMILVAGVFLIFSHEVNFKYLKFILGISFSVGAFLAFLTALYSQKWQIQYAYHEIHALAMLGYGIVVICFCFTLSSLMYSTVFLLIFYAFSEIIFCNWLFNLGKTMDYKIVFVRLSLGLFVGVATLIALNYSNKDEMLVMQWFGVIFIIIAINVFLYVPVIKKTTLTKP